MMTRRTRLHKAVLTSSLWAKQKLSCKLALLFMFRPEVQSTNKNKLDMLVSTEAFGACHDRVWLGGGSGGMGKSGLEGVSWGGGDDDDEPKAVPA